MNSKNIAVSAVSASLIAVFLILGAYITVLDISSVVIASLFTLIPLYKKNYLGAFLCFLAGGVIAFMCYGFNPITLVFPSFFAFFGIYPIVSTKMLEKGVKVAILYVIGIIWCVAVCYGLYFYYTLFMGLNLHNMPLWVMNNIYYILAPVAIAVYFVFEFFIRFGKRFLFYYLSKIIK